jgi:hypothetical protein
MLSQVVAQPVQMATQVQDQVLFEVLVSYPPPHHLMVAVPHVATLKTALVLMKNEAT